jgi:uncharacterized membrane protein
VEVPEKKRHTTAIPPGVAAAAVYFFPFIGGLVMLAIEEEDLYVRFHAAQSILFWVVAIPWALLSAIPVIGIIFSIAFFILWIFLMYQAWTEKEFEIPYLGAIARRQVFGEKKPSNEAETAYPGEEMGVERPRDEKGDQEPGQ